MILIGQKGEAEPILRTNPQLSRRVGTPRYMHPFQWDRTRATTIAEFCTIMECIDLALPFDPSGLGQEDMAQRFYAATNGYLGWIMKLIRHGAHLAMLEHCSTLNRVILQQSYEACIAGTVLGEHKRNPFSDTHFTSTNGLLATLLLPRGHTCGNTLSSCSSCV